MHYFKVLSAIATWTLACTFALEAGTADDWGLAIFVATIACVPTFWLMVDAAAHATRAALIQAVGDAVHGERERTEQLVEAVALRFALDDAERDLPRLVRH